jgi:hypothetical protein
MAVDLEASPTEVPSETSAAELERLRNQDPLLDSMVRHAQVRAEYMQWSLQPHSPLPQSKLRAPVPGMKFPRLENLTVLELKQFIASIPTYLDLVPIHYVDFGGWESPQFYLSNKPEPALVIRGAPEETVETTVQPSPARELPAH